jgi:hypothetical protein
VDVSAWLHGDDSELILLINPHKEGLGIIVEDTSAFGPFTVKTASLQESVSLPILNIIYIFEQRKEGGKRVCSTMTGLEFGTSQ